MSDSFTVICSTDNREEWLDKRTTGIGASDMPSILGQTNWGSALSVQTEKWGLGEDREQSEFQEWGHLLEAPMAIKLSRETGMEFQPFQKLLRSVEHPWAICTPDAATEDLSFWAQFKSTMLKKDWEDGLPDHVYTQMQHEMLVTGADCEYIGAVFGFREFGQRVVERDERVINEILIPTGEAFWKATLNHDPYEIDGSDQTKAALVRLHPDDKGGTVTLDETYYETARRIEELGEQLKALSLEKEAHQNALRLQLGDATYAALPDGSGWSWKTQNRAGHFVKAGKSRVLRRVKEVGR